MTKINFLHPHSPLRIFAFSAISSLVILTAVLVNLGLKAFFLAIVLVAVELTFSFDNAIINAKVLSKIARPWQILFLTAGVIIAIFGMRIVFPVIIVAITAHLGWQDVINMAMHQPHEYARHLEQAHASIAAFGGAFLLMLALNFFLDDQKRVHWIGGVEKALTRFSHWSVAPFLALFSIVGLSMLPANTHGQTTVIAGLLGVATYIFMQTIEGMFTRLQGKKTELGHQTGMAALASLLYLEVLDASFSFDGVIGAFAVTSDVVLIAAGLGIGALWVRSLTIFMVRRRTLSHYIYVEHGAHYTVFLLACVLLASVIWNISNYIPGLVGIGIIGASVAASMQERRRKAMIRRDSSHF